jgi:SAM-dependent methyltransferase
MNSIILRDLAIARRCRIRPDELVLDVGSGQHPFLRANVLVDRFITDSSERAWQAKPVIDRPFVVADATHLPFADQSFDVVISSHLLEHVDDPDALLRELQRVGKRGYIETPSRLYEKMYSNPYHAWLVSVEDGRLLLEEKSDAVDEELQRFFHGNIDSGTEFGRYVLSRLEDLGFLVQYYWQGNIRWSVQRRGPVVDGKSVRADDSQFRIPSEWHPPRLTGRARVKSLVARSLRSVSSRRLDLGQILRCPKDQGRVMRTDRHWRCEQCDTSYPLLGDLSFFTTVPDRADAE